MKNRLGPAPLVAIGSLLAFVVWSWVALGTGALAGADAASRSPGVDPVSPWGQILAAVALVTTPTVVFVALALLALWAARRRLSNLAWAIGLSIPLTLGTYQLLKLFFRRPRPDTAAPLITAEGWSYPSGHMAALTVLAVFLVGIMVLTRRRRLATWGTALLIAAVWGFVFYDRLALRAHTVSDVVGGAFLGALVASASLALAGVRIRLPEARGAGAGEEQTPRAAMIINPVKIPDPVLFRRHVEGECAERGFELALWLETRADEPGAEAATMARDYGVDLVFVAGGDGTVRTVCATLAGTGIPVAILPVGTGNLLARNLAVPLDLAEALNASFDGEAKDLDLVTITPDDGEPDFSMVMAGMGADATMMGETNTDLKKVVGPAAYAVAALAAVNKPPFGARIRVDDADEIERQAAMVLVSNVGQLVGNITLSPDAVPDDGLLDVLVASPKTAGDWAKMTQNVLVGADDAPGLERAQAKRVVVEAEQPVPYQIDGDALGECRRLEAVLQPGAVKVMVRRS